MSRERAPARTYTSDANARANTSRCSQPLTNHCSRAALLPRPMSLELTSIFHLFLAFPYPPVKLSMHKERLRNLTDRQSVATFNILICLGLQSSQSLIQCRPESRGLACFKHSHTHGFLVAF